MGTGRRPRVDAAHGGQQPFDGDVRKQQPSGTTDREPPWDHRQRLVRWGVTAWAIVGITGLLVFVWLGASRLAVVVVPMLLALFPAALLEPAVNWLNRHRIPRALATLLAMVAALGVVGGVFALIVPQFMAQLPALTSSLTNGANRLNALLERVPVGQAGTTAADLLQQAVRGIFGGIGTALQTGLNVLVGLVLLVVVLACYLTSGRRIVNTGLELVSDRRRPAAQELADRVWHTLGSYTRALFLVALFDATSVGLGLWLLGIPLVLPLSVLVFFGAFIPYIGAFLSGLLAVLVAFADGGLGTALAVLALIFVVQQIEGNVVQPLLMGKLTRVSAFTVIVAVSIGATLLGVLGALLAVPAAACIAQAIAFARERMAAAA